MASNALSPMDQQYGNPSGASAYGSGESENGKSALSMSLGFLKGLTEKKNTRVDGQPLKRRGPKPDSKPALTRRQELNRQAQRTHRERKELYIKALEEEVLRLKETFSMVTRDKDSLAEENRQLRSLLAQHGINWNGTGGIDELTRGAQNSSVSTASMSGSYGAGSQGGFSPPPHGNNEGSATTSPFPVGASGRSLAQHQVQRVDYDQAGIDFVLTINIAPSLTHALVLRLERPCMDHIPFLIERAAEPGGAPCGHALMATYPESEYDPTPEIPFGHGVQNLPPGRKAPELTSSNLATLLDLSRHLNLDGEITPVMAWGMILGHPRFSELTTDDFETTTNDLKSKVRCYGFGAVLEEFEVRDSLENVFSMKPDMKLVF